MHMFKWDFRATVEFSLHSVIIYDPNVAPNPYADIFLQKING